jgi:hypothetical protein
MFGFQVFADGFPELSFRVDLKLKANPLETTVKSGGTPSDSRRLRA